MFIANDLTRGLDEMLFIWLFPNALSTANAWTSSELGTSQSFGHVLVPAGGNSTLYIVVDRSGPSYWQRTIQHRTRPSRYPHISSLSSILIDTVPWLYGVLSNFTLLLRSGRAYWTVSSLLLCLSFKSRESVESWNAEVGWESCDISIHECRKIVPPEQTRSWLRADGRKMPDQADIHSWVTNS